MTTQLRCSWAGNDLLMTTYHDEEWGVPMRDSRALWQTLMLEGFQAGLSWSIILNKREGFRRAFLDFDPEKVARFGTREIELMMADPGIVRARAKIESTIAGARIYLEMQKSGEDFADYCWSFTKGNVVMGDGKSFPTTTPLAEQIAKDLKKRGFKFVGPSIAYAWMQAVGIVNDHSNMCFRRKQV